MQATHSNVDDGNLSEFEECDLRMLPSMAEDPASKEVARDDRLPVKCRSWGDAWVVQGCAAEFLLTGEWSVRQILRRKG